MTILGSKRSIPAMEPELDTLIKRRQISFTEPHADPSQAGTAAALLRDAPGVTESLAESNTELQVTYDLSQTCLLEIEARLVEAGLHLDNNLMQRIRRALYHYVEETQRENMGLSGCDNDTTRKVFLERYKKRRHGCRDERPRHWRRYL